MFSETEELIIIISLLVMFAFWALTGIIMAIIKIYDRLRYGKFDEAVRSIALYNKAILDVRQSLMDMSRRMESLPLLKLDYEDEQEDTI